MARDPQRDLLARIGERFPITEREAAMVGIEETPLITKILDARMVEKPSKVLLVIVETETGRLVLRVREDAALKLREVIEVLLRGRDSR